MDVVISQDVGSVSLGVVILTVCFKQIIDRFSMFLNIDLSFPFGAHANILSFFSLLLS